MNYFKKKHSVESLLILMIFGLFTVTSFLTVMIGANVYKRTVTETETNNSIRATFTYMANKIRSSDNSENIRLSSIKGVEALEIYNVTGDGTFITYIFYKDGYLRQLDAIQGYETDLDFAERIVKTDSFTMEQDGSILTFKSSSESDSDMSIKLNLRYN